MHRPFTTTTIALAFTSAFALFVACANPGAITPAKNANGYQTHGKAILPTNLVGPATPGSQPTASPAPSTPRRSDADIAASIAQLSLNDHVLNNDELAQLPAELKTKVDLDAIRAAVFTQINKDRAAAGLAAVVADKIAEQAGDLQNFREATARHMLGHVSLNGDLPYMRYSQAGGADGHVENWASAGLFMNLQTIMADNDPSVTRDKCPQQLFPIIGAENIQASFEAVALRLHCNMVNEIPGQDGHRVAILDPTDTGVGIGLAFAVVEDQGRPAVQLFMTQEFTHKSLVAIAPLPLAVSLSAGPVPFRATMPAGFTFDQMQLFFETRKALTPDQAISFHHYSLPDVFTLFLPRLPPGMDYTPETKRKFPTLEATVDISDANFSMPLVFKNGTGVYTVVVWIKNQTTGASQSVTSRSIFVVE